MGCQFRLSYVFVLDDENQFKFQNESKNLNNKNNFLLLYKIKNVWHLYDT